MYPYAGSSISPTSSRLRQEFLSVCSLVPPLGRRKLCCGAWEAGYAGFSRRCVYLILVSKDLAALHIPDEELTETELVLLKSAGSMVHYKSGRPLRFWEAVGGRLFLTNEVLEFRAHIGQPWLYRLTIPLTEIADVMPCKILGIIPSGLRIERREGSFELFTFGAHRKDNDSESWASAILAVRAVVQGATSEVDR